MSFKVKYINHKGEKCKVTIRKAKSKKQVIKFVRTYIGKPYKIKQLK